MSRFDSISERENELGQAGFSTTGNIVGRYDRIVIPRASPTDPHVWGYYRVIADVGYRHTSFPKPGRQQIRQFMFHEFRRHWIPPSGSKKGQYQVCHRGLNDFADIRECPVCAALPDNHPQPVFAFTLLGIMYYHMVTVQSKRNPAKTYKQAVLCEATKNNKHCAYCTAEVDRQLGHLGHTAMGNNNAQTLWALDAKLSTYCACSGRIHIYQAACPRCHQIMASVETSGMSDSEFREYLKNTQPCNPCKVLVKPVRINRCDKCTDPKPLGLTDAALKLRMVGVPGRDYTKLEGEIVKIGPLNEKYGAVTQLDLPAIYAPEPLSRMRFRMRLPQVGYDDEADPNAVPASSGRAGLRSAPRGALPPDLEDGRQPARLPKPAPIPPDLEDEFGPDTSVPAATKALREPAPDMDGFEGDGDLPGMDPEEDFDLPPLE